MNLCVGLAEFFLWIHFITIHYKIWFKQYDIIESTYVILLISNSLWFFVYILIPHTENSNRDWIVQEIYFKKVDSLYFELNVQRDCYKRT